MAKKTPTVQDNIFTLWAGETNQVIMQLDLTKLTDWPDWVEWLQDPTTKSFRYVDKDGRNCKLIKEMRFNFGLPPKTFWYAHKRPGKSRRRYLGKSENLTYQNLKQVTFELSQWTTPD